MIAIELRSIADEVNAKALTAKEEFSFCKLLELCSQEAAIGSYCYRHYPYNRTEIIINATVKARLEEEGFSVKLENELSDEYGQTADSYLISWAAK